MKIESSYLKKGSGDEEKKHQHMPLRLAKERLNDVIKNHFIFILLGK